ncbi:MAG TPA: hypothetical protein VJ461_01805 [Candidatus Nanoarchaeia archaeon]|nr:hypothetical protein [Candidatus Nanoarchaeia archaeon]
MFSEIPQYGLRAYALFFSKHGSRERFRQSELDWIVGQSMKKKIFAVLLKAGWIVKESRNTYRCIAPEEVITGLLDFRVPEVMKQCERKYAFARWSAIEIWSDYSYVQREFAKSPYFIKILKKDLRYFKEFFNRHNIPNYVNEGSTIGEFVILIPVDRLEHAEKDGLYVEPLRTAMRLAKANDIYAYAYSYMRNKYGAIAT